MIFYFCYLKYISDKGGSDKLQQAYFVNYTHYILSEFNRLKKYFRIMFIIEWFLIKKFINSASSLFILIDEKVVITINVIHLTAILLYRFTKKVLF